MKYYLFSILLLLQTENIFSQNIYHSTQSEISFFSEAPLENIDATNKDGKVLLNIKNGELVFIVAITGFKFKKELMEQHFNENYLESTIYKTAHFKGEIIGTVDYFKNGNYVVIAKGILNIHGVDQEREVEGVIAISDSVVDLSSNFEVALRDHKIKIPKVVAKNIAENVTIKVKATLIQKTN